VHGVHNTALLLLTHVCIFLFIQITTNQGATGHGYLLTYKDDKSQYLLYVFCINTCCLCVITFEKQNSTSVHIHFIIPAAIPLNVPCCKFLLKFHVSKLTVAALYNCLGGLDWAVATWLDKICLSREHECKEIVCQHIKHTIQQNFNICSYNGFLASSMASLFRRVNGRSSVTR